MVSNGFICAHKLLGYFLLPVRIMLIIPFLIFALITIWLYNFGILPKDAGNFALKVFAMMLTTVFGLNVHIKKDKAYEKYKKMSKDDKFLVIYNHINPLDSFVLDNVLDEYISFITFEKFAKSFPLSYVGKFLDIIKVSKTKRTNGTERIYNFLKTKKTRLCVAPDQCRHFKKKEYIGPFRTGAFAHKNTVLPLVIRYVPSYRSDIFNWNHPRNKKYKLLNYAKDLLVDGNIDVYIKFLDIQKYDENKFKNSKEYAEDVRKKMRKELKKMPKQGKSKLRKIKETNIECIFFITFVSIVISILALFFKDFEMGFHMMSIAFSGFLYHSFPSNSTLMFDRLFVLYGAAKLLAFTNTEIINILKYCIVFYSTINCIKNNLDETVPSACGGRSQEHWLKRHLYDVQIPMSLAAFVVLVDRNLFCR